MRIYSWNVNSIRARLDRVLDWLDTRKPAVALLQELKCTDEAFPTEAVRERGYHIATHGQKTYNGVAILARSPITDVQRGLQDGVDDTHARFIAGTVEGVRVMSLYAPNGQAVDSPAYQYKLEWYARLRSLLDAQCRPDQPLCLGGDWNVAPTDLDVYDPEGWHEQTLCTTRERDALADLVAFGLVDTYRKLEPETVHYTWWDYRMLAFPKNRGLRIDHLYATAPLADALVAVGVDREARKGKQPSDHAPVWAEFKGFGPDVGA